MNDALPRCAVPGSSCRLLQLETPGARPVWAVLDAAGVRHFTGEITLHVVPQVRAWFSGGELYAAERDGDPALSDRLLALGVLCADDLAAGSVQVGDVTHLGRLFDRVPSLDRDRVELALEILTGEVVGEIADHVVGEISIASYRHHPSGLATWHKRPAVMPTQVLVADEPGPAIDGTVADVTDRAEAAWSAAPVGGPVLHEATPDPVPTAEDEALVAEYEASFRTHDLDDLDDTQQVERATPVDAGFPEPIVVLDPVVEPDAVELVLDESPTYKSDTHRADEAPTYEVVSVETPTFEAPAADAVESLEPELSSEPSLESVQSSESVESLVESSMSSFESSMSSFLDTVATSGPAASADPANRADQADPGLLSRPVFELSVADILAELAAETGGTAAPVETPETLDMPQLHDVAPPTTAAAGTTPNETAWQIDDRIDWHTDAGQSTAPAAGNVDAAYGVPTSTDGPVVEFDLSHLLAQAAAGATPSIEQPGQHGQRDQTEPPASSRAVEPTVADDEVRLAVQAALAEIEAATRTGGDHEVPSILMQAALADIDTPGDPISPGDLGPARPIVPPAPEGGAPTIARPVLPDRSAAATTAGPLDTTPIPTFAPADDLPAAPAASAPAPQDADAPAGPPTQDVPTTGGGGGLRRLLGTRKP